MATATKIRFTKTISYSAGNVTVVFQPIEKVPGFSHCVVITRNGRLIAKDWLAKEAHPSEDNVAYYLEKHQVDVEQIVTSAL